MEYQERLRRMALSDDGFVRSMLGMGEDTIEASGLDPKTHAMVRIVGILIAIAPAVGLGRVVSAAPQLGLALGYDVDPVPDGGTATSRLLARPRSV